MTARRRLIISIACATLAALAMLAYASSVRASEKAARDDALARYGGEQVEVYVAAHDLAAGETIDTSDVKRMPWLVDLLPADCIPSDEDIAGSVVGSTILANEPVSRQRLGSTGTDVSVPPGLCAVSIPMQDVQAVGGAVRSGSLVNLYADTGSGVGLLGENLLVLATNGGSAGASGTRSTLSWVTLAVTPDSVQELLAASQSGTLFLTLPDNQSSNPPQPSQGAAPSGEAVAEPEAGAS